MQPAVEFRNISKAFGPVQANLDVSFSIAKGSIHGVIGENGAGKSTLMSILYGYYNADSGQVLIDGKEQEWPEPTINREVLLALAGQDPAQFSVWQELKNSPDKEVLSGHPANLAEKGVERFYTVMKHTTEGSDGSPSDA